MQHVKRALENFLNEDFNSGLFFVGQWGIGKTHYIQEAIKKLPLKNYDSISYVSIFNMKNTKELEDNIHRNIVYMHDRKLTSILSETISLDKVGISGVNIDISKLIPKRLNKTIVIIDDFERRNKSLECNDILSLMNRITQNFSSKFIIISNDNIKNGELDFKLPYYDKLISNIINFERTEDDISKIIKEMYISNKKNIMKKENFPTENFNSFLDEISEMKITNIRIIYRMFILYLQYVIFFESTNIHTSPLTNQIKDAYIKLTYLQCIGLINVLNKTGIKSLYGAINYIENVNNDRQKNNKEDIDYLDYIDNYIFNKKHILEETKNKNNIYFPYSKIESILIELLGYFLTENNDSIQTKKSELKEEVALINEKNKNDEINELLRKITTTLQDVSSNEIDSLFESTDITIDLLILPKLINIYYSKDNYKNFLNNQISLNLDILHGKARNIIGEPYYITSVNRMENEVKEFALKIKKTKVDGEVLKKLNEFKIEVVINEEEKENLINKVFNSTLAILSPIIDKKSNKWRYNFDNEDYSFTNENGSYYLKDYRKLIEILDIIPDSDYIDIFFENEKNLYTTLKYFDICSPHLTVNFDEMLYENDNKHMNENLNGNSHNIIKNEFKTTLENYTESLTEKLDKIICNIPFLKERIKSIGN